MAKRTISLDDETKGTFDELQTQMGAPSATEALSRLIEGYRQAQAERKALVCRIESLEARVKERDDRIAELEGQVAERESELADLRAKAASVDVLGGVERKTL